ncbi:MAG: protein translocase subunit SecD [Schaalia hyovaginalis]|uniref:protein translocase subunit SecD n=1 Tax=Schaalia hyovaginalis TaxID=29316 RepID=UPI0023F9167D|nr:protein translocase subunit SecD [Schaalia hyovaginalis]MCI7672577.1 protein translocase subunit SecD [Schaalia hyovaginalis]MDY5506516.1 protein translocase subunit SecD [Schaalia hyovaginalis]
MSTRKRRPLRSLVTLLVAIIAAVTALVIGNLTQGASYVPSLALDLQGGTQLILTPTSTEADDRQITEEDITQAISIIRNRIDASGVAESEITSMGQDNIVVSIPGTPSQETLDLIRSSSQMNFRPVLQIAAAQAAAPSAAPAVTAQSGATGAQSGEAPQSAEAAQSGDQPQSTKLTSTALDEASAMQLADTNGDGALSADPASSPENASDLAWVTEQALFDFYTLDCAAGDSAKRREGPADKPFAACDDSGAIKYLLGPVSVAGANLDSANAGQITNSTGQTTGQWGVDLQFDKTGTQQFADSSKILYSFQTQDAQGQSFFGKPDRNHFAVVLDGVVITAPSMNAIISDGRAQISGNFTAKSATALANQLNFGSLPLNFEVQSEQRISATLGSDHLEKGLLAGAIGLLLVICYLIWQYRGLSIISAGSLILAAGLTYLTIAILSWTLGYRLSLAGVAGLIMAVGVTADSFIVYFERVRDEVRDGRPLVAAVDEGWDRAKRTILVSDAVNIVAAVVLYLLAVGGVQGFAFTLGVTTLIDLVVIFLFTHPMMELLIRTRFFGQGHPLSGLDPEHLGAKSGLVYAGRGRVAVRAPLAQAADEDALPEGEGSSIAQRRRAARLAAKAEAPAPSGLESNADTDGDK